LKLYYRMSPEDAIRDVQSDAAAGLTQEEATRRLAVFGYNELLEKKKEAFWQKFLKQFKDVMVLILLAASLISAVAGEPLDSLVILAIVVLNATLGVFQESKAEKAMEALKKMSAPTSKVTRAGVLQVIPSRNLVPGDIVVLEAGDNIPADLRIIESFNLKAEEASLTGESVPSEKNSAVIDVDAALGDRHNMGFMSTVVTYGRGKGLVVGTGMKTEIGKIAAMLQNVKQEITPMQKKLAEFGRFIALVCIGVCIVVFIIGMIAGFRDGSLSPSQIRLLFMTAVSLAVASIPEGLPAIVTIVLALGMQRMARKNAIIKKLHAVETLGSVSVICSDKTGTLTRNEMTVTAIQTGHAAFAVSGEGYSPEGTIFSSGIPVEITAENDLKLLLRAAVLCNDAQLKKTPESGDWSIIGDPTEGALIAAAAKGGFWQEETVQRFPRIQEIPFDSSRKMMTTFHEVDGKILSFCKGAPDIVLNRSSHIAVNGVVQPLTEQIAASVSMANKTMASRALRVLAIAYREFDGMPVDLTAEHIETGMVFTGLMGMIDPPRSEVKIAVQTCKEAGIRPMMITGDHPDTALAIARELGINDPENHVVDGRSMDAMPPEELRQVIQTTNIFARVSPENKVAIVEALRYHKYITAMTGDGVNDAPAMKRANIGVAMGITGTDVTKETADMVIADDNFASIVTAVEEGRVIYANIQKTIYFLLSCNAAEILVIFIAILAGWPIPLLPIHLLWVNLVTDALPALALGVEAKEPNVMRMKPRNPDHPLLNAPMQGMLVMQSLVMAITILGAFQYALISSGGDITFARTFAFVSLISTQLLCTYSSRSELYSVFRLGFFSNLYLNIGVGVSCLILLLSVQGSANELFKTVELGAREWFILACLAPIPFLSTELYKAIRRFMRRK